MPYKVKKVDHTHYMVYNTKNGKVKSRHTTKTNATRQIRLLNKIEREKNK